MSASYTRVKAACYVSYLSQAAVFNLSPVFFLTFHTRYGISYSLLGLLVLINFVTQLIVDLVFSLFSHRFNLKVLIRLTPCLTVVGLLLYALSPVLFPNAVYGGLAIGTVIFAAAGGFAEVFVSPIVAAIPSEDPDREMSKLHSIYAWGVVGMVLVCTVVLRLAGDGCWPWLTAAVMLLPLLAAILYAGAEIPPMETQEKMAGVLPYLKNRVFWLCLLGIFFGGASECAMSQWCSGYLEQALGIPKIWGDLFGMALFALMLGLGRTLYARYGKRIETVLFAGSLCAAGCYLVAALSPLPFFGLLACAMTGFFTSMLWPGSLIAASDRFPHAGVFLYAIMAAGGDTGASAASQLVGVVTDAVIASPYAASVADSLALTPDQLGMKLGMLVGMLFPIIGALLFARLRKTEKASKAC